MTAVNPVALAAATVKVLALAPTETAHLPPALAEVWQALKGRLAHKPAAQEALADMQQTPLEADVQAALRVQLRKILAEDEIFAQQLTELLEAVTQHPGVVPTNQGAGNIVQYTPVAKKPLTPLELRIAYLGRVFMLSDNLLFGGTDINIANDGAGHLSLSAVYTALATQTLEHFHFVPSEGQSKPTPASAGPAPTLLSALAQLNQHPRLVLLGDPGSGKSTFTNFVALCLSGEGLGRADANLEHLAAPLPDEAPETWAHGSLLPVRVVLRDFAARGLPPPGLPATAQHLWGFITNELAACGLEDFEDDLHAELLGQGGLLLLDGLDEVPEADERRAQLQQAVEDFATLFGKVRILATSRPHTYQRPERRLPGFKAAALAPFTPKQVTTFVRRWHAHLAELKGWSDAASQAADLAGAIARSPRLSEMATRPLLLLLMTVLHTWRSGALPEKREGLYAAAVDLLLDQWEHPKTAHQTLAEQLQVDRDAVRRLLNELACHAHAAQPAEQSGTADVPEGLLVRRLQHLSQNAVVNSADLVDYLSQRAGLLLLRGPGTYTFPHRTFQEYLAACHLTDHDYPQWLAQLAREDYGRWREVALLAAAKATRGSESYTWLLVNTLCSREVDTRLGAKASDADFIGALLAGQVLLEAVNLQRVDEPEAPKLKRVRQWLVRLLATSALTPQERAQAGEVLAALGDPRAGVAPTTLTDLRRMQFCYVPPGPFIMGEVAGQGADPKHINNTLQKGYWLARHPVTVGQWRLFVEQTKHTPESAASLQDTVNHPVRYVSWYEALKFCDWLNAQFSEVLPKDYGFTLPNEAEWEKAARGGDTVTAHPLLQDLRAMLPAIPEITLRHNPQPRRLYPWGDEFEPNRANVSETNIGHPSAVGCFPKGQSPYGCQDMVGNLLEWTRSLWGPDWDKPQFEYPHNLVERQEDLKATPDVIRVLRGSAFYTEGENAACAQQGKFPPSRYNFDLGFRIVVTCLPS